MFGEATEHAQMMRRPLSNREPSGRRAADDFRPQSLYRLGEEFAEPRKISGVRKDRVFVDPAAAMIAGDVNKMIVVQNGVARVKNLQRFVGGRCHWFFAAMFCVK